MYTILQRYVTIIWNICV